MQHVTNKPVHVLMPNQRVDFWMDAGAKVEPIKDEPGFFWLSPENFPRDSFYRYDLEHYGFRVAAADVD